MISSKKIEEFVADIATYKQVNAIATLVVGDDKKVEVTATVSIMGMPLNLEEVSKLLDALPKAIERAGGLAVRLTVESKQAEEGKRLKVVEAPWPPFETPKAVPVGNLNDHLSEGCATHHEHEDEHEHEHVHPSSNPNK